MNKSDKPRRNLATRLVLSFFHAVLMLVVTLLYLGLPFTTGDEVLLVELTSSIKNALFKIEEKPDPDRFLFVCVSWEKQLIDKLDTNGFPIGQIDITNRQSVGNFLKAINEAPTDKRHKFLLVDIRFYDPSPTDSLIRHELGRLEDALVSYHKDASDKPRYPIFKAPLGLSDMESQVRDNEDDMVLKYHLIQGDTIKTTPLLMYEMLHGNYYTSGWPYDKIGKDWIFNSFIIEHPIRNYDLKVANRYPYVYLGELAQLPPEFIHEYTKDKIIIMGDFENLDIHKTIYGEIPGPVILLNAFLSLERGYNHVDPWFIAFLIISFMLISYKTITVKDPITLFFEKRLPSSHFMIEYLADTIFYLLYFALVSIISYSLFNIHLTILFLSIYMSGLENFLISIDEKRKKKLSIQQSPLKEEL